MDLVICAAATGLNFSLWLPIDTSHHTFAAGSIQCLLNSLSVNELLGRQAREAAGRLADGLWSDHSEWKVRLVLINASDSQNHQGDATHIVSNQLNQWDALVPPLLQNLIIKIRPPPLPARVDVSPELITSLPTPEPAMLNSSSLLTEHSVAA